MAELDQSKTNAALNKLGVAVESLPSNESVLHNLNKVKVELDKAKSAPEIDNTGRRILQDAELLVDDMKIMIKERNEGDRMQILAREAKLAAETIMKHSQNIGMAGKSGVSKMDKKGLQRAAKEGFTTLQLAITEIIRSSEFRSELMEFLRFAADVFRSGVKDNRKDYVTSSKHERKINRAREHSSYTEEYHCKQCDLEASKHKHSKSVIPEKVTSYKDNAEITLNTQLDKLNIPTRVELSDEQLEELVNRFMDIMRSISSQPRTREAFLGIMHLIQLFYWELDRNSGKLRKQSSKSASRITEDDHVRNVILLLAKRSNNSLAVKASNRSSNISNRSPRPCVKTNRLVLISTISLDSWINSCVILKNT